MKIIYDFDGTLTPYAFPQYKIIKQFGYDDLKLKDEMKRILIEKNTTIYEAFYSGYSKILAEHNIAKTKEAITYGCEDVEFNPGLIDYFENYATQENGISNYIVTSGIEDYVKATKIAKYISGIYGVQYNIVDGIYDEVLFMLDDKQKPNIIKKIIGENNKEEIIYIGDGMTDEDAFKYVKSIGGYTIFVGESEEDKKVYQNLKENGIIDKYCLKDYSKKSELRKYIDSKNKSRLM